MILEDLHKKQFLLMSRGEKVQFLEKYRAKRQVDLETVTARVKRTRKNKKKGKVIKVDSNTINQLKQLGLIK